MAFKRHDREYDLVVFGATGYTGKLTCQYIAESLPSSLRWAISGRSESKLREVVEDCRRRNPDRIQPKIETCNLNDDELDMLTKKTYVLMTLVGPYAKYGSHAYRACASHGTHYLDVTGEAVFTARMIAQYSDLAASSGAMLFSQVGIESVPSDLCTWVLAKTLRDRLPGRPGAADVVLSVRVGGRPSGGTLASALGLFDSVGLSELKAVHRPFALSPVPHPGGVKEEGKDGEDGELMAKTTRTTTRRRKQNKSFWTRLTGLRTLPDLGLNTTSIAQGTDGAIVGRTWGLLASTPSRKAEAYGPDFGWAQYMSVGSRLRGAMIHLSLVVFGILLATAPPFRALVRKYVVAFQPGEGPDMESASKTDFIEYRGIAKPDAQKQKKQGGKPGDEGPRAYCEAKYRGPMYYFTGILVAQAALTILEDDLELPGGAYTPACLGQGYVDRLAKAGFPIEAKIIE